MTRILLACGIGASTGFMAANMRKAAKAQGLDVSIHAVSKSQVPEYADKIDVLLLGPHFSAEVPKYKEMCRRFLADTEDFSEEHLKEAGIEMRFQNDALDACISRIKLFIQKYL